MFMHIQRTKSRQTKDLRLFEPRCASYGPRHSPLQPQSEESATMIIVVTISKYCHCYHQHYYRYY